MWPVFVGRRSCSIKSGAKKLPNFTWKHTRNVMHKVETFEEKPSHLWFFKPPWSQWFLLLIVSTVFVKNCELPWALCFDWKHPCEKFLPATWQGSGSVAGRSHEQKGDIGWWHHRCDLITLELNTPILEETCVETYVTCLVVQSIRPTTLSFSRCRRMGSKWLEVWWRCRKKHGSSSNGTSKWSKSNLAATGFDCFVVWKHVCSAFI